MASMRRYTLHELRDAALQQCPEAFAFVSDISKFALEERVIARPDRLIWDQPQQQLVLHLAFFHTSIHKDRVFAAINPSNSKIAVYHGKPGESLSPAHKLFPNPEKLQNFIVKFVEPFDLATEHPLVKSNEVKRRIARKERRSRAVLLAQWAFLLAGQIDYIEQTETIEDDLPREFVSLCQHIQQQSQLADSRAVQQAAEGKRSESIEENSSNSITKKATIKSMFDAQEKHSQLNSSYAAGLSQGDRKRKAPVRVTNVSLEDDSDTPLITRRPRKMQRGGVPTSGFSNRHDRNAKQEHQLAMRPSPSPSVLGPRTSTSNATMPPSPPRANNFVSAADVKSFLDNQARKMETLERELRAEKQRTLAAEQKTRDAEKEAARWRQAYEGLKTERDNYFNWTRTETE